MASCKNSVVPPDRIDPPTGPDTTSHNFVWTIDTLGDGSGGTLYDVAIINDTLAYAVGEIYLKDSTGQVDPIRYNLARWDGASWNISRLQIPQYNSDCTVAFYSPGTIKSVFAFNANNILLMSGLSVTRWNEKIFINYPCLSLSLIDNGRLRKIWGISENDFYCVGTEGTIFHFANSTWTKIESGTTLDLQDIWGDGATGEIIAVAAKPFQSRNRLIASITGSNVISLSDSGIAVQLEGIWFVTGGKYVVVGDGIYRKTALDGQRWSGYPLELTTYYNNAVRGTDTSNVFVVGDFMDVLHYNGSTWKSYPELRRGDASLYGLAAKGKLVMAAGFLGSKPLILRGVRQ